MHAHAGAEVVHRLEASAYNGKLHATLVLEATPETTLVRSSEVIYDDHYCDVFGRCVPTVYRGTLDPPALVALSARGLLSSFTSQLEDAEGHHCRVGASLYYEGDPEQDLAYEATAGASVAAAASTSMRQIALTTVAYQGDCGYYEYRSGDRHDGCGSRETAAEVAP